MNNAFVPNCDAYSIKKRSRRRGVMFKDSLFTQFCKSTSAHGFYKLARTRQKWLRLVWLVIIVSASVGFSIHLMSLITRYLDFPVNTETKLSHVRFVYPDVTICGTDSFSKVRLEQKPIVPSLNLSFDVVLQRMKIFWKLMLNSTNEAIDVHADVINSVKSHIHEVNVTHMAQDIIIYCRYKGENCSFLNFKVYFDPAYMFCFTFQPKNRLLIKGGERDGGLSLILYAGDSEKFITKEQSLNFFRGFRVAVHSPGTRPNLRGEGFYAQVGFNTMAQVDYNKITALDKPSRNCAANISDVWYHHHRLGNLEGFKYTLEDCHIETYQRYLNTCCHCVSESLPLPRAFEAAEAKYCHAIEDTRLAGAHLLQLHFGNFSSYSPHGVSRSTPTRRICHDAAIDEIHGLTADNINCPVPCSFSRYPLRLTRANWPDEAKVAKDAVWMSFLNTRKLATDNAHDTSVLDSIINKSDLNQLVKLDIYATSKMGDLIMESWAYPIRNLFSDLGGILGLWLGISAITLFEFLELLVCVCGQRWSAKTDVSAEKWAIYRGSIKESGEKLHEQQQQHSSNCTTHNKENGVREYINILSTV